MTLAILVSATIALSALVAWSWWNSRSSRERLRAQLIESWGVPSAEEIGPTEMHAIADYSLRYESGEGMPPRLDDTTWSDLDMDRVFQRANVASSTPGEEVLYDLFRRPAVTMEDWAFRHALVSAMEADPSVRVEAQVALRRLGKQRHVDTVRLLYSEARPEGSRRSLYLALSTVAVATAIGAATLGGWLWLAAGVSFLCNVVVYYIVVRHVGHDFLPLTYLVRCLRCAYQIPLNRSAAMSSLGDLLRANHDGFDRIRTRMFHWYMTGHSGLVDIVAEYVRIVLLRELIDYETLRREVWEQRHALRLMYRSLGMVDAAIALASLRRSLATSCVPELCEAAPEADVWMHVEDMVHPLIDKAVPNSFLGSRAVLVTGSNASGKSTYLKGVALAVVLAQAACTVPARSYRGCFFRVLTSMGERDSLATGKSTYVAELESLRRIIVALRGQSPVLACLDEMLRGTNTVDRIAVSAEVLRDIAGRPCVCLAATHDLELTYLLETDFTNVHFREDISETNVSFDYRLRPGRATQRNALSLVERMGFAPEATTRARLLVDAYEANGSWPCPTPTTNIVDSAE